MKQFTVVISEEEEKALLVYMVDVQEWLDNAIHNRARLATDAIIQEHTDKQPQKLSTENRKEIINNLALETALDRNNREAERLANLG